MKKLHYFFIALITCSILVSCAYQTEVKRSLYRSDDSITCRKYPRWFLHPYQTIVGYAPRFYDIDKSVDATYFDALETFSKLTYCVVDGKKEYIQSGNGWQLAGDSLFITIVPFASMSRRFLAQIASIDTFVCNETVFTGYHFKELNTYENEYIMLSESCKWINELPIEEGYLFAVGVGQEYACEYTSWKEAENNAIINLARSCMVKEEQEILMKNERMMSTLIEEVYIALKKIHIVERWYDKHLSLYYTLIKMPLF